MIYLVTTQKQLFDLPTNIQFATVDECLKYCWGLDSVQTDTETEGFDIHTCDLICLQLGDSENQFVIDTSTISIQCFKELLETKLLLLQNAKFDLRFFYKYGIYPTKIYDTFLVECVLTTGYEKRELALDKLVHKYCKAVLNKDIRGLIHKERLSNRVIIYSAEDVRYLHDIRDQQLQKIKEFKLENVVDLENEAVLVFAKMEFDGVLLNQEKWLKIASKVELELEKLTNELDEIVFNEPLLSKYVPQYVQGNLFGFETRDLQINWSSSAQKLKLLKDLGLNIDSTDERSLQKNKRKHKIVPKLLEYSKQAKLASSFGRDFLKFVNKATGRIHPDIWQILRTGRISVKHPNLNQIPSKGDLGKEIRSCFIAKKNHVIVGGDFSGMELRLIAEFSKDPMWVNAFNNGEDLHSVLCAKTFDIPIEDVKKETPFKKNVTYRDVQKTINFGLAYGMSKFKLADTMDIPVDEADKLIKKFFNVVPKVDEFLKYLGSLGKQRGYIRTSPPYRRIRFFDNWNEAKRTGDFKVLGAIERASMNTPIQGSNGDIIKLALINVQKEINKNNYPVKIILAVYDEIQTECHEDFAEEWKDILDSIMINSAKEVVKSVPIEVDSSISKYWTK